jgi:hypothetical protein
MLMIFSLSRGFEPTNSGTSGQHANRQTTEAARLRYPTSMRMRHIAIYGLFWLHDIFPHYLINGMIF